MLYVKGTREGIDSPDISYCNALPPAHFYWICCQVDLFCWDWCKKGTSNVPVTHQIRLQMPMPVYVLPHEHHGMCKVMLSISLTILALVCSVEQMAAEMEPCPWCPWCDRIRGIGCLCLGCYVIVVSQDSLQWLMKRSIWAKEK